MMNISTMEQYLPFPFKVYLNCDPDTYCDANGHILAEKREELNQKYSINLESFPLKFQDFEAEDDEEGQYNRYGIFVGDRLVYAGNGPDECDSVEENFDFYRGFTRIVIDVLETWREDVLKLQEERKEKVLEYENKRFDELLYVYYRYFDDRKYLIYLKRLAKRYPKSRYSSRLRRVYARGLCGNSESERILSRKMENDYNEYF